VSLEWHRLGRLRARASTVRHHAEPWAREPTGAKELPRVLGAAPGGPSPLAPARARARRSGSRSGYPLEHPRSAPLRPPASVLWCADLGAAGALRAGGSPPGAGDCALRRTELVPDVDCPPPECRSYSRWCAFSVGGRARTCRSSRRRTRVCRLCYQVCPYPVRAVEVVGRCFTPTRAWGAGCVKRRARRSRRPSSSSPFPTRPETHEDSSPSPCASGVRAAAPDDPRAASSRRTQAMDAARSAAPRSPWRCDCRRRGYRPLRSRDPPDHAHARHLPLLPHALWHRVRRHQRPARQSRRRAQLAHPRLRLRARLCAARTRPQRRARPRTAASPNARVKRFRKFTKSLVTGEIPSVASLLFVRPSVGSSA
jgi:hypothetical protein